MGWLAGLHNKKGSHKIMESGTKRAILVFDAVCLSITLLYGATSRLMKIVPARKWNEITVEETSYTRKTQEAVSPPRVIKENVLERRKCYELSEEDYENLLRIVEAEATGEDMKGKILVANVVMNRVKSGKFPTTVTNVIMQRDMGKVQFSPVADGRFYHVQISESTKEAVEEVVYGVDYSKGALYFVSAKKADTDNYAWFQGSLDYLFSHGGHEFYK